MPRRHRQRQRAMKGGFLDDLSNTLSGWGTSISEGASSAWQKTKEATSSLTGSTPSTATTSFMPTTTTSTPMTTSTYGGKHSKSRRDSRKSRRSMKGGFEDNTPITGLAAHAAPFSGPTAQPNTWVGGKTRRRGRKGGKSRKHRKH